MNGVLQEWAKSDLRQALHDKKKIQAALAMFKVAVDKGDSPEDVMRKVIADFVFNAINPEILTKPDPDSVPSKDTIVKKAKEAGIERKDQPSVWHKRHKHAQPIDEVHIRIVPRYKTSELSGDEWRFHTELEFFWKGHRLGRAQFHRMDDACKFLPWSMVNFLEERDYLKTMEKAAGPEELYCDNPGCVRRAVSTYVLKKEWGHHGEDLDPESYKGRYKYRRFCERHRKRGDGNLEDGDRNYVCIDGPGPDDSIPDPDDVSPSGGPYIIDLG